MYYTGKLTAAELYDRSTAPCCPRPHKEEL